MRPMWQWHIPKSGGVWKLRNRADQDCWIEYRPKLGIWDAIYADRYGSMAMRMAAARTLRTDDLFAAIGFLLRRGLPHQNPPRTKLHLVESNHENETD